MGTNIFGIVTLTLGFGILFKIINLTTCNNFSTVSAMALILFKSISSNKAFHGYQHLFLCALDLLVWPTYFLKTLTLLITLWEWLPELWYYTWASLVTRFQDFKIFLLVSKSLSMWPRPSLDLTIIGGICVLQTHLVLHLPN